MSEVIPTCPTGCSGILPKVLFDDCAPIISWGEIHTIFLAAGDAVAFSDWTDLAEWTARIDNSDIADKDKIRQLTVVADLPMATADEVVISKGRKVKSPATHVINFDIDDLSSENYEFMRTTACNTQMLMWFANDSFMYGGNDGILVSIDMRPVIERGIKSINKLSGTITWENQFSAEREDSVFAS